MSGSGCLMIGVHLTLHGGVMARDQLRDQHSLDLVARLYANNSGEHRVCLTPPLIEIVGLTPQNA